MRSCDCLPDEDVKYFGTFKDATFKPTEKIILRDDYETRKEANEDEIALHDFFDVGVNPHFANRAKHAAAGFCMAGIPRTEEFKQLMSEKLSGENNPMFGMGGELHPRYGKVGELCPVFGTRWWRSPSGKLKRSVKKPGPEWSLGREMTGKGNPQFGRTGELGTAYGKKWWVNANGEARLSLECPGPEWQPGRKWKLSQQTD